MENRVRVKEKGSGLGNRVRVSDITSRTTPRKIKTMATKIETMKGKGKGKSKSKGKGKGKG